MPTTAIATSEPKRLQAGDTWHWDRTLTAYPASDGWSLQYVLRRGSSPPVAILKATVDGDIFRILEPYTKTVAYPPGLYQLVGRVTKDAERFTIYSCTLIVEPDPANECASFAERMVDQVEAELAKIGEQAAAQGVKAWTQGGRSEDYGTAQDRTFLLQQLGYYREQVRQERGGPAIVTMEGWFGCVPGC